MTITDEARVTDEEIAEQVEWARKKRQPMFTPAMQAVIVELADRLAARDARIESLLKDLAHAHSTNDQIRANVARLADEEVARRIAERDAEREEMVALLERMLNNEPCADEAYTMLDKLRTP